MDVYKQLEALGIQLEPAPAPGGAYTPARLFDGAGADKLVYFSGMGPQTRDGKFLFQGKLGQELNVDEGYAAARSVGIVMLSQMHARLGDLNRVRRLVKVLGFVNAAPDFALHPAVINGFSELMLAVFGPEAGAHARSAVGVASLPFQIPVEVELLAELK